MTAVSRRLCATIILALLVAACATTETELPFKDVRQVWPAAPQQARIALVAEFSHFTDLGIRTSLWQSILSLTAGADDSRMVRPMAVAATTDASIIFVADPDANCVHRYDLAKRRYHCLGPEDDGVLRPVGLAVVDDERLVVSDSHRGVLFQGPVRGSTLRPFYTSENLDQPTGAFWNPRIERLYITDTGQQSLLEFDRNGSLKRKIGVRGSEPGQFNYPTYVWADLQNEVLVADSLNFRVQRLDAEGNFLYAFGKNGDRPGDFSRPKGVATDSFGHIYVVDALMHTMQIFSRDGALLMAIGSQGQGGGEFWLPNGIFITADNTIFVADSYNRRVQVFRYVGPAT